MKHVGVRSALVYSFVENLGFFYRPFAYPKTPRDLWGESLMEEDMRELGLQLAWCGLE